MNSSYTSECNSILSTSNDVDKIIYYSDCIFSNNIKQGIRMYVSRLYIQLHSGQVSRERIKLFNIFCQIIVRIDSISNSDGQFDSGELSITNYESDDIFEINCNFQIPMDVLMNKAARPECVRDDFSSISGFYQSNTANVHITFDMFLSLVNNFKDLILLFKSLLMNGRFDVVEIIVSEFHKAGEHSICGIVGENWLSLLNSFIPTASTIQIVNCIRFLLENCSKTLICYCKLTRWILVRSWALITATGSGFSIVLLFIKEMISFIEDKLKSCSRLCGYEFAIRKLKSMESFFRQYIYYVTRAGDHVGIFEYMEIQSSIIIHRILKSSYSGGRIDMAGCKNCDSGFIYDDCKCSICFDCAHNGLTTIYTILQSFLSPSIEEPIEVDCDYMPMWICVNTRNLESLRSFSEGVISDSKLIFSELLSLVDEVPFLCDLILVILTQSLDCFDVYNLVVKIESVYPKLSVKGHSKWLRNILHILERKPDISHKKCHCKEVKSILNLFSRDCDIAILVGDNLDLEANLHISDIRDAESLDGLYRLIRIIVANIDYAGHDNVCTFIKIFCSNISSSMLNQQLTRNQQLTLKNSFLLVLFISVMYNLEDYKPVYTMLLFELSEECDIIANFFYFISNPGLFTYRNDVFQPPNEAQTFAYFKYLLDNQCDPRDAITWTLDLRSIDHNIDSIRLKHSLLSSVLSICKWITMGKYPYLHQLLARITTVIEVYDLGNFKINEIKNFESKYDFTSDVEGQSIQALVNLISTLPYTSAIDRIISRLGLDPIIFKKNIISLSNQSSRESDAPHDEFDIEALTILEPNMALKLAENLWFGKQNIDDDCIWWFSGDATDYTCISDDNQILTELKCTMKDSFHSYRNLFDSVRNPKLLNNLDYHDNKCIKFLRIWSYDPEWAFLTLIGSNDWKFVFRKLIKYKPFLENQHDLSSQFFSYAEIYLGMHDQKQLKSIFEFAKILFSIDGNLSKIVADSRYRRDMLRSMSLEFIQSFYSSLLNIYCPPLLELQDVDLSHPSLDRLVDIVYSDSEFPATSLIHELNSECSQVMLDNLNLDQVSNPLVRMRLLLYPDKLISKLIKLNNKMKNGSNFRNSWFTVRKLLAEALEIYPMHVDIHGSNSIKYLHFIKALLYIMPEFDLYLLHKASITTGSGRWDSIKQHLGKISNRVSICAIKSLLEITDDNVKKLLIWLKLPNI